MGTVTRTDRELVEASRRGELEAFADLVARYQTLISAVSYSSTGDRGLGEDVAQETFLAAWRHLDRVRDTGRLRPWLCGIARNLGRKARKRTRREEPVDIEDHASEGANPFELVARDDAERVVRDALLRIPDAYREVLVLYYRDDCSIREVAETLGLTEAAVEQRLSRGRRHLADSVTALVERSLRGTRPRRDLVAAVLAAIAAYALPSRVDASPSKGLTMLKLAAAASALAVVGGTAYLATRSHPAHPASPVAASHTLHYGTGAPRPPTLAATITPRAISARTSAAGDLKFLPADSDVVLGIDVAQVRRSALWQQFVAPLLPAAPPLRDFAAACGFDPIASLGTVTFGLRGFGDTFSGTVVLHGIDKGKAMACFSRDGVARLQHEGVQVSLDGNAGILVNSDGSRAGLSFVDDTTALVVIGPDATTDGLAKIASGSGGIDAADGFATLFANVDATDSFWLVITGTSPVLASINGDLAPYTTIQLHGVYGSVGVSDAFAVQGAIRLDSPAHAAQIVADAQKHLDEWAAKGLTGKVFDQLDIASDGSDVLVDLRMTLMQLIGFRTSGLVDVDVKKSGS